MKDLKALERFGLGARRGILALAKSDGRPVNNYRNCIAERNYWS